VDWENILEFDCPDISNTTKRWVKDNESYLSIFSINIGVPTSIGNIHTHTQEQLTTSTITNAALNGSGVNVKESQRVAVFLLKYGIFKHLILLSF